MLIRVISDIHRDVNEKYPFTFKGDDKDVFTLVAGDISGNPKDTVKWVKQNIKSGAIVSGNHLVYNKMGKTIAELKSYIHEQLNCEGSYVSYLDKNFGMLKPIPGTNILVVGSTLYTDYKYLSDKMRYELEYHNSDRCKAHSRHWEEWDAQHLNKLEAARCMNDFYWGHVEDEYDDAKQRHVSPSDYEKWFKETFDLIKMHVENNPDKDIIVMTHHCPSPKCISDQYVDSTMNASYCSDLEDFIVSHPNIKAWVCGHVHHRANFKIGNCLIVMNPRGYERRSEAYDWNPNTFIDTDKWEIVVKPYSNKKLKEARDKLYNSLLKCGGWLW